MLLRTTQQSLLGELKVNGVDQHFQLLEFTSIDHLQYVCYRRQICIFFGLRCAAAFNDVILERFAESSTAF